MTAQNQSGRDRRVSDAQQLQTPVAASVLLLLAMPAVVVIVALAHHHQDEPLSSLFLCMNDSDWKLQVGTFDCLPPWLQGNPEKPIHGFFSFWDGAVTYLDSKRESPPNRKGVQIMGSPLFLIRGEG